MTCPSPEVSMPQWLHTSQVLMLDTDSSGCAFLSPRMFTVYENFVNILQSTPVLVGSPVVLVESLETTISRTLKTMHKPLISLFSLHLYHNSTTQQLAIECLIPNLKWTGNLLSDRGLYSSSCGMLWDDLEAALWVLPAFQCIPSQGQHTPGLPNMVLFTVLAHIEG